MAEIRVLSPCGVIGSGFPETSLERGLTLMPHVIACDGGSTDMGPASLGTGMSHFSRSATKCDLRLMLLGRERLGVPLLIGSGGNAGLNWMREICLEIAREGNLGFQLEMAGSKQDKEYLKQRFREGRIPPRSGAVTKETFGRIYNIPEEKNSPRSPRCRARD